VDIVWEAFKEGFAEVKQFGVAWDASFGDEAHTGLQRFPSICLHQWIRGWQYCHFHRYLLRHLFLLRYWMGAPLAATAQLPF
jgi:hypothetical protein